jgi:hypothetical protein
MIDRRKLNVMKVNAEFRMMRIKEFRAMKEAGGEPPLPPVIIPPEDSSLRNSENDSAEAEIGVSNG